MIYIIEKHDRVEIDTDTFTIEYFIGMFDDSFSKDKEDAMQYENKQEAKNAANVLRKHYPTSLIEVVAV